MKKRSILYLVNPIAGTRTKQGLESFLKQKSEAAGLKHAVVHSTKDMDVATLRHWVDDAHATDLVVCGGDGTVNLAASALQGTDINLGVIPVGSGNGLARCAGIPLKPTDAFEIILKGNIQLTDAFKVNDHFSCMLSGIGLDAAVAHRFAHGNSRGLYNYTKQTLIQFFKAHPYQFEVTLPDFSFFTDAFFISIANSNQFGNNMTIAPKASLSDGLLDLVIVQKMPKAGMPLAILRQVRGNNKLHTLAESVGKRNIIYLQTPSVKISNKHHAPLHVDGDPCDTADNFDVEIMPGAFKLLVP
jgi:diacylglycerol kinase (ATP)